MTPTLNPTHLHRAVALAAEALGETARPAGLLEHAELTLLRNHQAWLDAHRQQAVLYSALEPCLMCLGACLNANLAAVVYAVRDGERDYSAVMNATPYLRYRHHEWQLHAEPDPTVRDRMRALLALYWDGQGRPDKAAAFTSGGNHWADG